MNISACPHCKRPYRRTTEQNALLWAMLTEVSQAVEWYGHWLTPEEWKDVFTAALRREKVVPGINGGFVVLGQHTSKMDKQEFAELIELINAFMAEHEAKMTAIGKTVLFNFRKSTKTEAEHT